MKCSARLKTGSPGKFLIEVNTFHFKLHVYSVIQILHDMCYILWC